MSFLVKLIGATFRLVICTLIFLYVILPVLLLYFTSIHNTFIFLHILKLPWRDYSEASQFGVQSATRNFYVPSDNGISLGVWHIKPKGDAERDFETALRKSQKPVVLYLHGNAFTRASGHRIFLYNALSDFGYHTIAPDYRGFADSTGSPTEEGATNDTIAVYKWLRRTAPNTPVIMWGHSLGTALGTRAAARLCKSKAGCPLGLLLENPFNNFTDIIRNVAHTRVYHSFPWLEQILIEPPIRHLKIDMNTDANIAGVDCPILMLHAHDDHVVPVNLAMKLFAAAKKAKRKVKYIEFADKYGYNHNDIYKAPELRTILDEFCTAAKGNSAPKPDYELI